MCYAGRGESERRSASDRRNRGPQKGRRSLLSKNGTKVSLVLFPTARPDSAPVHFHSLLYGIILLVREARCHSLVRLKVKFAWKKKSTAIASSAISTYRRSSQRRPNLYGISRTRPLGSLSRVSSIKILIVSGALHFYGSI